MSEVTRLARGHKVRLRNDQNELAGVVIYASDANPQSLQVMFRESEGIRYGNSLAITPTLALTVDYEKETVEDLFGTEWEIDVADEQATYRPTD